MLDLRGAESTGWALGWRLGLRARLRQGDAAHDVLRLALRVADDGAGQRGGLYPNLVGAHRPFQIDGNFGLTAGIAELLVQSHAGTFDLLPALPSAWPESAVRGLRARGGIDVSLAWSHGHLREVELLATRNVSVRVRWPSDERVLDLVSGRPERWDAATVGTRRIEGDDQW